MNEKGKKEKEKYCILQIEKHDKKEEEEKVTTKENYTESNLENKYVVLEAENSKQKTRSKTGKKRKRPEGDRIKR